MPRAHICLTFSAKIFLEATAQTLKEYQTGKRHRRSAHTEVKEAFPQLFVEWCLCTKAAILGESRRRRHYFCPLQNVACHGVGGFAGGRQKLRHVALAQLKGIGGHRDHPSADSPTVWIGRNFLTQSLRLQFTWA